MFHICFAADENYIKYTAVLIKSIVKSTDTSREFKDFFDGGANTHALATRERERESKNGANNQNLAKQILNSQSLNFTNSAQNSQNSVNLMPNSAENSQIPQNLNQNSQNDNFTNAKFTHPQTAGTRTGALTGTQNSANSQRQNTQTAQGTTQTAQNSTNQNENSQFSVNLAAQNPTNIPKNSLESYKKLDYNSLSDDEKSEGYIFHILTDKITDDSRQKLEKLAQNLSEIYPCEILVHICNDAIFQGLPKLNGNYLAYFRLFIPNFMPRNLKMCLYLDTDMLALQDLRGLFALDLSGKVLAAVMDRLDVLVEHKTIDGLHDGGFYFNSGFLLMNLREWQRQGVQKGCFDFLRDFKTLWHEQDALNYAISRDKVLLLPLQYNLFFAYYHYTYKNGYTRAQNTLALVHPAILHFKPWLADFAAQNEGLECHFNLFWLDIAVQTPFYRDFEPLLQDYERAKAGANIENEKIVRLEKDEFTRLKNLEHFGGFVRFYTRKQLTKIRRFFAKIRRKTRFIRYPIKRFFGFGGEKA